MDDAGADGDVVAYYVLCVGDMGSVAVVSDSDDSGDTGVEVPCKGDVAVFAVSSVVSLDG